MNNYQNTTSGAGLLQDFYGQTDQLRDPLSEALKKRRMKLMQTKLGVQPSMDSVDFSDLEDVAKRQRGF